MGQGSPIPGPRTATGPWPVRSRAAQQEVSGGRVSKASSAAPRHSDYRLNYTPTLIHGKIVFPETGPWCRKGWGRLVWTKTYNGILREQTLNWIFTQENCCLENVLVI